MNNRIEYCDNRYKRYGILYPLDGDEKKFSVVNFKLQATNGIVLRVVDRILFVSTYFQCKSWIITNC